MQGYKQHMQMEIILVFHLLKLKYSSEGLQFAKMQVGQLLFEMEFLKLLPPTSQFQACQFPLRQPSTVATFLIIGTITNTTYCRSYIESYIF